MDTKQKIKELLRYCQMLPIETPAARNNKLYALRELLEIEGYLPPGVLITKQAQVLSIIRQVIALYSFNEDEFIETLVTPANDNPEILIDAGYKD